ncbi:torsin-1A-interacting protein 2 isoform X1 [Notothenia coriiceps]|uniref:Torsin-1A-interacting protein 2 isoform X1 n=2 Tax=Notothenia coriiceps TaxID=8208 RepID=A0A6I9PL89_9TELE|nr:PREDICTED: torsin-1A-interacting protein 2-like isoform X1 [Notothenia coriiceps]
MDSRVSEIKEPRLLRRSVRQSSGNVRALDFELTPRGPLKRTRRGMKPQSPVKAVNGSRDEECDSEDEVSPSKKSRLEDGGAEDSCGDANEMEVQEPDDDQDTDEDQGMDIIQQSSHASHQVQSNKGALGDMNLSPCVVLKELRSHAVNKDAGWIIPNKGLNELRSRAVHGDAERIRTKTAKGPEAPAKSSAQIRPPVNRRDVPFPKVTSMDEYRKTLEAKAKSTGIPAVNHHQSVYPASEKSCTRQRANNIPTQKQTVQQKKQVKNKSLAIKKSTGYSCSGFMWGLFRFILVALIGSAVLVACKIIPVMKKNADGKTHPPRPVKPDIFADQLSLLQAQFPSQHSELWRRSKIHLEKHLKTAQPTEPVSLIFTAGRGAEKTLSCLAQRLASSYSSALNASVLHIDGASRASHDSDEVKLDIDNQLRAAFEGDKPAAVIHRFEELPPGSTLIFYRYCDHENAAYKRVFLLFTVLLPQDEIIGDQSLKEVEEMVLEYVKEKLIGSSNGASFNDMDIDKFGGLWSRISHLILPVVSEKEVEQKGC